MYTLVLLSLSAAISSSAPPQQPSTTPLQAAAAPLSQLSANARAEIVDTVAAEISRFYADADTGQLIAEQLRKRLSAHAYDSVTDPRIFAAAVTTDLRAINHDQHLALTLRGQGAVTPLGTLRLPPLTPGLPPAGTPPAAVVEVVCLCFFWFGFVV